MNDIFELIAKTRKELLELEDFLLTKMNRMSVKREPSFKGQFSKAEYEEIYGMLMEFRE